MLSMLRTHGVLTRPARFAPAVQAAALASLEHGIRATTVGCPDREVAASTRRYLRSQLGIELLDPIRLAHPLATLAGRGDAEVAHWARRKIQWSSRRHASGVLCIVAHAGCTWSPGSPDEQIEDLCESVERIAAWGLPIETVGLWVDETGFADRLA